MSSPQQSTALEASVRQALSAVIDPNTGKDIISTRSVRNLKIEGEAVSLDLELGYPARTQLEPMRQRVISALRDVPARNRGRGATEPYADRHTGPRAGFHRRGLAHERQRARRTLAGTGLLAVDRRLRSA